MDAADKNTSVFLDGDFQRRDAEAQREGAGPHAPGMAREVFGRKEHKERKEGGSRFVATAIDRSGWKRVRLGDVLKNVGWCNSTHPQSKQVRQITQGDDTGETSITTDYYHPAYPVILFGDHTCNVKYIDFDFHRG